MLINADDIKTIFGILISAGYYFQAQSPQQLLKYRKYSEDETELVKLFGIGDLKAVDKINISSELKEKLKKEPMMVSCDLDGNYLIHSRWPPQLEGADQYIHLGPESFYLAQVIKNENLKGKKVLDLGCSSGVLSFEAAKTADEVVGLDASSASISAAKTINDYRKVQNIEFYTHKITKNEKVGNELCLKFDLAIFNPPLGIPVENNYFPHRDGGHLGYEIPLMFINYSIQALKAGGEIWCLIASPILSGQKPFEIELANYKELRVISRKVVDKHFNQMVYKSHGYDQLGIDRIELTIFKIKKI